MANVQIKRYSGSAWVDINPKTTIGQVINLSSQLANMQSDIDGKATKLTIPQYTVPYRSTTGTGEPNTNISVSTGAVANTVAQRYTGGRLAVGTAVSGTDAINLTQGDGRYLPLTSLRDFVHGTTINTSIDYSQSEGAPFLLKIYGNTYNRQTPTETVIQGYIYNNTIINYSGYSIGNPITGLVALNVGGKLTFWFPRQGYWEGYFAEVFDVGGAGRKVNLVTSILDTVKPVGTKEVTFNNILNTILSDDPRLTNARTPTAHSHTIAQVTGLQGALDGKSQRIILTGQLQTTSYRRSVIALCELTNTNPSANSYSVGTLTFHRTNGLSSAVKYDFAIEKRYNTEGFNLSQTVLASAGFINGIKPCIFIKNGIKYGGIEVFFSDAELREIEFHGTTNFGIFGLDYYVTNTSTPLDTEVNNSLVLDDPDNIRVSDSFKSGNQLVVLNNDPRLTNARTPTTHSHPKSQITNFDNEVLALSPAGARPASDVSAWAKKASLDLSDVPTISIAKGGTGATTALAARANLGLGNGATASNVIRQSNWDTTNKILTIEVV